MPLVVASVQRTSTTKGFRFPFAMAILLNLVTFVKNLLFNSVILVVLATVFTVARCAGPLATHQVT